MPAKAFVRFLSFFSVKLMTRGSSVPFALLRADNSDSHNQFVI